MRCRIFSRLNFLFFFLSLSLSLSLSLCRFLYVQVTVTLLERLQDRLDLSFAQFREKAAERTLLVQMQVCEKFGL